MSKISLRDYNHEIEGFINTGKTDEAIAHCKYILKLFPKCVDTYRLLGKAYLEAQRYSEATDILTRILSVVPDDFVSQIGMSIIREDEGNLDAAIYHMERAFEVKPSNSAIQEELRRLYGRRDGITPPRVRLTRGALVRMYTRGELYPQAIAEIRASLAEDPKRVDLEVILARIYMILGRKAEAIEVCSRLINKLPNCLEANRILADVLPGTSRAEDAETYRQRVIALDPYSANITSSAPTSNEVPDNAILIDFLEYQPSQQASQQPEWANSIGVNLQGTEEAIPDWLVEKPAAQGTGMPEATPPPPLPEPVAPPEPTEQITSAPASEPAQAAPPEPSEHEALIPDWMKSAGWAEASPAHAEVKETPAPAAEAPEEIAHAELPDWIKAIAPAQGAETPPVESEQEDLAQLDQLLTSQPQETAKPEEAAPVEQVAPAPAEAVAPPEETQPAVELPAMLEGQLGAQATDATARPAPQEEVPDWLAGLSISSEIPPTPAEELPDWLKTFASEPPAEASVEPVSEASSDWLKDLQAKTEPAQVEETPVSEISPQAEEPIPEWLQGLGGEIPATNEIAAITPVETQGESPAVPAGTAIAQEPEAITPEPQPQMSAMPAQTATTPEAEAIAPEAQPEIPAISPEVGLTPEPETKPVEVTAEEAAAKTQPVAVKKIEVPVEEVPAQEVASVIAQEPALESVAAEKAPEDNIDAALAWLESLAVQQGADQETLLVPPEQRTETPPEWIKKEIEAAKAAVIETPPEAEVEAPVAPEIQPVPQAETEAPAPAAEQIQSVEEIPQPSLVEENVKPAEAVTPAVEVPIEEISPQEAVPAVETGAPKATAPEEMDLDAAFAWLESLAARQGAGPETLLVPTEEKQEQPPAGLQQAAAKEETKPVVEIPEPAAEMPPAVEAAAPEKTIVEPALPTEPVSEAEIPEVVTPVPEVPVAEIPVEVPVEEEPLPDWLKGMETPPVETPPAPIPSQKSITAWLKNVQVPEETTAGIVPEQPVEETPEKPLPEWLQGIGTVTAFPTEPLTPAKEPAEELPEWLQEAEFTAPEKAGTSAEEGLPEWLLGIETTPEIVEPQVIPVEPVAEEIIPTAELPLGQPAEVIPSAEIPAEEKGLFAELPQEQPAEVTPPTEMAAEEVGQVTELPQEQPAKVVTPVEVPTEEEVPTVGLLEEQPMEILPAEEQVPVAEELPQVVTSIEQPEITAEIPVTPVEEILQPAAVQVPEELSAVEAPVIAGMDISQVFAEAKEDLDKGDLDQALPKYSSLIESQVNLEEIIRDMQNALYRHPVNVDLYEVLGDAYARSNRLQDALDTYTKAEELLVK